MMNNLAKVATKGTILGLVLILATATFSAITAAVTSESKEIPEEIPEYQSSLIYMERIFPLNDTPLASFDGIELSLVQGGNALTTEDETVDDIDPLIYYGELQDEDPLTMDSEIPEPDWSVIPLDKQLVEHVFEEAAKNEVDPCVVIALMQSESGFYTDVVSCAGCYGLMQLHPLYYPEDMTDPYKNIQYGVETIGTNLKRKDVNGNYIYALSMYANGHIGKDFTYQYDVMRRAEEWRTTLREANIL